MKPLLLIGPIKWFPIKMFDLIHSNGAADFNEPPKVAILTKVWQRHWMSASWLAVMIIVNHMNARSFTAVSHVVYTMISWLRYIFRRFYVSRIEHLVAKRSPFIWINLIPASCPLWIELILTSRVQSILLSKIIYTVYNKKKKHLLRLS